jgi:hypothetical protein
MLSKQEDGSYKTTHFCVLNWQDCLQQIREKALKENPKSQPVSLLKQTNCKSLLASCRRALKLQGGEKNKWVRRRWRGGKGGMVKKERIVCTWGAPHQDATS